MPNDIDNTVTPADQGSQLDDAAQATVTDPTPPKDATTLSNPTSTENTTTPNDDAERLRVENERLKAGQSTLQKRLDRLMRQRNDGGSNQPQYSQDDIAQWAQSPLSQEMLMKAAEAELKEGVEELFKDYSSIPDPIKKAIAENPRGWVKPGTVYVEDAINDIEDFLSSLSANGDGQSQSPAQAATTTTPKPKEFPIAGTNAGSSPSAGAAKSGEPQVDAILELFQKGKPGLDEAFRRLTEGEVGQKTFDKAIELAEKSGLSIT